MQRNLAGVTRFVTDVGHMPAQARHNHVQHPIGEFTRGEYRIHEQLLDAKSEVRAMTRFAALGWALTTALLTALYLIGGTR